MGSVADVRHAFVELWGAMGPFWGISPTTARVYSWLLSRADPADAEEIMEGAGLSRGSVSMACRELREWGLVVPERDPHGRRALWRPTTDPEKVVRRIVEIRKRREWDPILENLRDWIPRLDAIGDPDATIFRERLVQLEALVALADQMVDVFLRGGTVSRLGLSFLVRAAGKPGSTMVGAHAPALADEGVAE